MTDQFKRPVAELVAAGIQSPNWDRYNKYQFADGEYIAEGDGEPLPEQKLGKDGNPQRYDLIFRSGERRVGTPLPYPAAFGPTLQSAWMLERTDVNERVRLPVSSFAIIGWQEHQKTPPAEAQ